MKRQKCIIKNKSQLITAVGCAMDFFGETEIILNRKSGTTKIVLKPSERIRLVYDNNDYQNLLNMELFNKELGKMRTRIRKTPAECFR